jgi:hypothetical protein
VTKGGVHHEAHHHVANNLGTSKVAAVEHGDEEPRAKERWTLAVGCRPREAVNSRAKEGFPRRSVRAFLQV